MNKSMIVALLVTMSISGCATMNMGANFSPIIDGQAMQKNGKSSTDLINDTNDCQRYAKGSGNGNKALLMGLGGALLGAALGANAHSGRAFTGQMANYGAISGLGVGAAGATMNDESIVRKCMAGRGYQVLN